jgi:predicted short-subunit dehydrogenase-like oxidoreductase (DUF2520 family)
MQEIRVAILGAGNVAYQLAWHLHNAGHVIVQIYSRHIQQGKFIANLMDTTYTDRLDQLTPDADVYLLCVNDDSIAGLASRLQLGSKLIAHTSASVPISALKDCSSNFGIFYPLQTLSKNVSVDFANIPIVIDGSNAESKTRLEQLASSLSRHIIYADDEKRLAIHVAAVFANNFTNHLYAIAQMILEKENLSFDILKPLLSETVRKVQHHAPLKVQTGPAERQDVHTLEKHLNYLKIDGRFAEIYKLLSDEIARYHPHS